MFRSYLAVEVAAVGNGRSLIVWEYISLSRQLLRYLRSSCVGPKYENISVLARPFRLDNQNRAHCRNEWDTTLPQKDRVKSRKTLRPERVPT